MKKYVEMQFNADLRNVVFARGVVASFFVDEDFNLNMINEVKTIVSEAVTNAIVHGYEGDTSNTVKLMLELDDKTLKIEVSDKGIGIKDIIQARQPLYTTKVFEERAGLGFTIMDIFSDSLEVISCENEGTTLLITKSM